MSKVDKLLIQGTSAPDERTGMFFRLLGHMMRDPSLFRFTGIRSFGYREGEHAVVVFNTPLTIIVGQNGAGKTASSWHIDREMSHLEGHPRTEYYVVHVLHPKTAQSHTLVNRLVGSSYRPATVAIECSTVARAHSTAASRSSPCPFLPQTIIECLKYATTGEIPPMSKGGAFIHDLKLVNETEIKAKVKLQFRDRAGNKTVVSRIMQATQKVRGNQQGGRFGFGREGENAG